MAQDIVDNQQFESFPQLKETPEEIAYELRARRARSGPGAACSSASGPSPSPRLAFAYFYLRSANNGNLWRPGGITAPTKWARPSSP